MRIHQIALLSVAIPLMTGCAESRDERLARMATESTTRQAEQNQELVRLNREVAEGTRRVVEADAHSRQELIALQQDLQGEQAEIGRQRDRLEQDRKELAQERRRESVLAAVLYRIGELALCALPLVLCWYLLHGLWREPCAEPISDILIEEITSAEPLRLENKQHRALPDERGPSARS